MILYFLRAIELYPLGTQVWPTLTVPYGALIYYEISIISLTLYIQNVKCPFFLSNALDMIQAFQASSLSWWCCWFRDHTLRITNIGARWRLSSGSKPREIWEVRRQSKKKHQKIYTHLNIYTIKQPKVVRVVVWGESDKIKKTNSRKFRERRCNKNP